jgi:hypothetical protein
MDEPEPSRLSQISTKWSDIVAAHSSTKDAARLAQQRLVDRYCGAVHRYLLSATADVHAAEDLTQTFALRFVRGDFEHADPSKGRFRDFIKTVLYHLVVDYFRDRKRFPKPLPEEAALSDSKAFGDRSSKLFAQHWRQEILNRTWQELQLIGGANFFEVLRWKANHPDSRSIDGAEAMSKQLGRPMRASGFRQTLLRAREQFAQLLIQEVATSLATSETSLIEQELADLELIEYCRPILEQESVASAS